MRFQRKPLSQRPYLLLTLAVFFWALNLIVGRGVHGFVPPVGLAFWRWAVSALIVLSLSHRQLRRDWPLIRRHWKILLLLSAVGIGAYNTLLYIGLQSTTAINGLLLQTTMPLMIVLISFILFGQRISGREVFGIAVALSGAIVIVLRGNWHHLTAFSTNAGDLWIFTAILCYALYSSLLRLRPPIHPLSLLTVTFAIGAVLLLPLYVDETLTGHPVEPDLRTLLAIGYVAVFPSIVSFLCFNRGVELVGANRAGLFMYLMPLFGSLIAVAFLGEHFQHYDLIGFGLIITGIGLQRVAHEGSRPDKQGTATRSLSKSG